MKGTVFDIQRFSIHDGPGIRTTVFLKGCPLNCLWCHNPESKSKVQQLSFTPARCIGCRACLKACKFGGHKADDQGTHIIDRKACMLCGECVKTCYAEALEMIGKTMSVDEVITEVMKDKPFYETSGGGMTISGGEPLFQPDFSLALLKAAKEKGLDTAIETSGFGKPEILKKFIPLVDHFMYDIKETDDSRHRRLTGVPLEPIVSNLKMLNDLGVAVLVRFPLVPGVNAIPEHFEGIGKLAAQLDHAKGFEIMPFHRLGEGKLDRLGMGSSPIHAEAPENAEFNGWIDALAAQGVKVINERKK